MSFLFEKQTAREKDRFIAQKKISMDVRAPQQFSSRSTATYTRQKGARVQGSLKRVDGFRAAAPQPASFHYVQRLSAFERSTQARKLFTQESAFPKAFLQNIRLGEWFRRVSPPLPSFTPNKLIYGSIMSGVAFGMISLGVIEKTFEAPATASEAEQPKKVETVELTTENYNPEKDVFLQYFSDEADAEYQAGVRELVKGHPIEEMLPYIFEHDRITAAFLIGIAKKESNWGKRRPVLDGQDCFNYWGYRGQRRLMGSGGHTCFNSRKDAVDTVARRLQTLINSERLNTPEKLIVWKCGMSCEGHSRESVQKWISDVDAYYSEMMGLEGESDEIENIEVEE